MKQYFKHDNTFEIINFITKNIVDMIGIGEQIY